MPAPGGARETNFLIMVERGIFGYPRSPYRPLLKVAGCELGDLQAMVRTKGLETILRVLCEAGVYVSFEEFKGRTPIVRDGQVIPVRAQDFDNPYLSLLLSGREWWNHWGRDAGYDGPRSPVRDNA